MRSDITSACMHLPEGPGPHEDNVGPRKEFQTNGDYWTMASYSFRYSATADKNLPIP